MPMTPLVCAAAILIALAAHSPQRINSSWPLQTDSRVRIQATILGDKRQTGTLVTATNDSVVFQGVDEPATLIAVVGGATAAYSAATWSKEDQGPGLDFGRSGDAPFIGGFGAIEGAVLGLAIRSIESDMWAPVQLR